MPGMELSPCAWCGLLTGPGPACLVCGSPMVDTSVWSTVLPVPLTESMLSAAHPIPGAEAPALLGPEPMIRLGPEADHSWVSLADAAGRTGLPADQLRAWVEARLVEPLPSGSRDQAWFLLVDPVAVEGTGTWLVRPGEAPEEPVPSPLVLPGPEQRRAPRVVPRPDRAPAVQRVRRSPTSFLAPAWAFLPNKAELRRELRDRVIRAGGAAVGTGSAFEIVYLLLRSH